jgi:hypothetical protein
MARINKRSLEEMIGSLPKESIEDMIGSLNKTATTAATGAFSPIHTSVSTPANNKSQDLSVINFERPAHLTPLPPPSPFDSLQTIVEKLEALADVVTRGDSLMVATNGEMLTGWDASVAMKHAGAEDILSLEELAELRTIEKILNIATTRVNEVRAEFDRSKRELGRCIQMAEERRREVLGGAASQGRKRKRDS